MTPLVAFAAFDGVAKGVAVVEDLPQRGLFEVGRHHIGLDLHGPADQLGQDVSCRVEGGLRVGLDDAQDLGIGDETGLDDLGQPCDDLVAWDRFQGRDVDEDGVGFVEGADEVLACIGVDAGLTADCRVDHRQQCCRDVDDADPAHPGGGDESGEIGGRAAAEADHLVVAFETDLPEHTPAERGDLQVLTGLGIGNLDGVGIETLLVQKLPDLFGCFDEGGLKNDRDPVGTGRRLGDLTEQTPADHHVVRGSRVDSDPDRFGRTGCRCGFCRGSFWRGSFCHGVFLSGRRWSASAVTTASAISAALPAPASTVIVARPV